MRKIVLSAALAAALVVMGGSAALAVEDGDPSAPSPAATGYTPVDPTEPTLGGSTAVGECDRDVPWINYSVFLLDPDNVATGHVASLVMTAGDEEYKVELGTLVDNKLSGRVLWPGAEVDENGNAIGWPGWTIDASGTYVPTDENFAWTRGDIKAVIQVNPQLEVPLSYPEATPDCATNPIALGLTGDVAGKGDLARTGVEAAMLPISLFAGALVLVGVGAMIVTRRRGSNA
ncbi:hypothetical protein GCM10009775_01190 [Microbacterium aoyamense]|uniref:LPXTG-motif cell wall anchor domain-containing protein n=1 Tax=Microbacterium aoyamense TaxID=344166 RepID=A0ABP5AF86_9MICO|nr:cell wall protein [Microbacterium aoyamense]